MNALRKDKWEVVRFPGYTYHDLESDAIGMQQEGGQTYKLSPESVNLNK